MNRRQCLISLLVCSALVLAPKLGAQQRKPFTTAVDSFPEILVCEFDAVHSAPAGQGHEAEAVRVRRTQILKDANGLGLEPGELDVTIRRASPLFRSEDRIWIGHDSKPGLSYLVILDSKDSARAIVERPRSVEQVTGGSDVLADVELNLKSASLPVSTQAQAASMALAGSAIHSRFMSEYVAWLLAAGSDLETEQLLRTLGDRGAVAFTEDARMALLWFLRDKLHAHSVPSDNLVRALAGFLLRSLIAEKEDAQRQGLPSRSRVGVVADVLPEIWKSPRALAALRQVPLTKSELEQAKVKALECASDARLNPAWRAQARDLAILLNNR